MIPKQLQQVGFRFCKLSWKPDLKGIKGKIPAEADWQNTKNYSYDSPLLQDWITQENNIGVCTGYKMLFVPDIDSQEEYERVKDQLPETFMVKSGGRGLPHYYYFLRDCDQVPNRKIGLVDLKGLGGQVVCCGSKLKNEAGEITGEYTILNDAPIAAISWNRIKKIFNITEDKPKLNIKEIMGGTEEGNRNDALFRMACSFVAQGMTKSDILAILDTANNKNTSKLSAVELIQIRDSAWKYHKDLKKEENKKDKPEEKIIKEISFLEDENYIYEQVYNGENHYARYNKTTEEINYVNSVEQGEIIYKPIEGEEIQKKAIMLPTKAELYSSNEEIDQKIKTFINKWLDVPDKYQQFAIWNIKRSWVFERFHTLNYLRALGDTGQGKSRFLDTLGAIHYKPIATSGATTAAPVFRIIDKWKGTMIFDECDLKESEETADIIKIINMGYERGKFVMRCDQNDATKVQFFDPFCPKILATRKPFVDKAVESRCITQVMMGTRRKDITFTLTEEFFKEAEEIRNKLLTWRFKNFNKIDPNKKHNIDFSELEPRVQQIITSYAAMFGNNDQEMSEFKEFVEKYQADLIEERATSFEGVVVNAIHDMLESNYLDITAQNIIDNAGLKTSKGQPMNPNGLKNVLKELGFETEKPRRFGGIMKRCLKLEQEHLNHLFKRYGCNAVTLVTLVTETSDILNKLKIDSGGGSPHRSVSCVTALQRTDNVFLKCSICGQTVEPCVFETIKGKPLCKECGDSYTQNGLDIDYDNIK